MADDPIEAAANYLQQGKISQADYAAIFEGRAHERIAELRAAAAPFAAFRLLIKDNGTGPVVTYTEQFKNDKKIEGAKSVTLEVEDFDRIVAALAEK
jgi:hypothetical protein